MPFTLVFVSCSQGWDVHQETYTLKKKATDMRHVQSLLVSDVTAIALFIVCTGHCVGKAQFAVTQRAL